MATALRLCHQRALAEEITQGAFLLAWRGLPRFQKGRPFRPWLMRILYRHALDVMEKQGTDLRPLFLDDALASADPVSSQRHLEQGDLQEQVAEREAVRQALASPAMPSAQPATSVSEPARDLGGADTLKDLTAASSEAVDQQATLPPDEARVATVPPMAAVPPDKPPGERVTPTTPQPVVAEPSAPPDPGPRPDSSAVTRFIERPVIPAADEPRLSSETPTVILDPNSQRAPGMRLVASTGPAQGSIFDVGEEGATLGRLPENSICLTDGRLSRHHASVEFRDGGYWLKDLGSQNGTLVNDHALTEPHLLQAGDTIELGTTRLTVMLDSDD